MAEQYSYSELLEVYPDRHDLHKWSKGDRGFTHYDMKWGTVSGDPDDQGWFNVKYDEGGTSYLNAERFVVPRLAKRFGYGEDPNPQLSDEDLVLSFAPQAVIDHFDGEDVAEDLRKVLKEDPTRFKTACAGEVQSDVLWEQFHAACVQIASDLGIEY